ncbi:hypothetical protein ACVSMD_31650, partial [Pseudomonas aeruginosa]
QRLLGVLALVVLFGAYVGWSERPRILLHYSGQASAPIAYSYKEQGVETFSGEIRPGQVREFPVKLFGGSDYRIAFSFHRGEEKYASFSTKPGWGTLDLYVDTELSVSTQPPPEGLI